MAATANYIEKMLKILFRNFSADETQPI